MAADPDATAKSILATVAQIDTHLQSIAKSAAAATSSLGGIGGGPAGAGGGFGGTGSGNAGSPAMPPVAGSGAGGHSTGGGGSGGTGGSSQGRLGLGTIVAAAGARAIFSSVGGLGNGVVGNASAADILSNQFAIQGGNNASMAQINQRKSTWMRGGGISNPSAGLSGFNGYNSADNRGAAAVLATQYAPSLDPNSGFQRAKAQIGQESLNNPGISATSLSAFGANTAAPQTYNSLRLAGITATDKNGNGLGPSQLAANILKRIGGSAAKNPNMIRRALMTGGALDQQLTAAGITGDQRTALTNDLMAQASGNTGAQGNTIDASTKRRATAADNKSLQTDQGVIKGAEMVNQAATTLNNAATQIYQANKGLADTIGRASGAKAQSGGHATAGLAAGLVGGGHGSAVKTLAGAATGAAIGSVIFPGVGTAVGGVLGGIAGFFGGSNASTGAAGGMAQLRGGGGGSTFGGTGGDNSTKKGNGQSTKKVWPVGAGNISQPFGGGPTHNHPGTDFPRPLGTPIHAAADGVVIFAGPSQGFGNLVSIFHAQFNVTTRYGHEKAVGVGIFVKQGQQVKAGDTISVVGSEGESTGPHVHVELGPGNTAFGNFASNRDVVPWLGGAGTSTSGTPSTTTDSKSSSKSSSSASAGASADNGFSTISAIQEGTTASLLMGGAGSVSPATSGGSSGSASKSSSSSSSAASTVSGRAPGNWSKLLPPEGQKVAGLIQAAAHQTGINPALIAAISMIEDDFGAGAFTSSAGAQGAMQFEPGTAAEYGVNVHDPGSSFLGGAKYMKALLAESKSGIAGALEGYNSGTPDNPVSAGYAASVMSYFKKFGDGGATGSYKEGAWEIQRDQMAQIHQGEMVVPQGAADQIRKGGKGGHPVTIQVTLANASNAEAMRLVGVVKQQLESDDLMTTLAGA